MPELGRYPVGEAGFFITRVVAVKASRGGRILLCDGGMNAHLAAAGHFGMVLRRNCVMHRVGGGEGQEKMDIAGPLCTSIDRLAAGAILPRLEEGDLLAVCASPTRGLTVSPLYGIAQPIPRARAATGGPLQVVHRFAGPGAPSRRDTRGQRQPPRCLPASFRAKDARRGPCSARKAAARAASCFDRSRTHQATAFWMNQSRSAT